MRKALVISFSLAAALIVAATAGGYTTSPAGGSAIPGCAAGSLDVLNAGTLTIGADNPAFPPWFGGEQKRSRGRSATHTAERATSRRSRTPSPSSSASRRPR